MRQKNMVYELLYAHISVLYFKKGAFDESFQQTCHKYDEMIRQAQQCKLCSHRVQGTKWHLPAAQRSGGLFPITNTTLPINYLNKGGKVRTIRLY